MLAVTCATESEENINPEHLRRMENIQTLVTQQDPYAGCGFL